MDEKYARYLETVDARYCGFVTELDDYLLKRGLKRVITAAKNGNVLSYYFGRPKRALLNIVMRKSGMKARIYTKHIAEYLGFLDTLPEGFKKEIAKAPICKRLANPDDCSSKCPMGYVFAMDGQEYAKCRYTAFMPSLTTENNPFIMQFLENEIACEERAE